MWDASRLVQNLLPGFGLVGGLWISLRLWRAKEQEVRLAFLLMAWAAPLILVGGKLLYVLERGYPLTATSFAEPGYSLYGSFFLVVSFWVLAARIRPFPLLLFLDCVTPAAAFALVLGRINCFVGGCCGGTVCGWPWGIRFRPGTLVFSDQLDRGLVARSAALSLPAHPTQLYEAFFALFFGLVLLCLVFQNRRPGLVFFAGMIGYSGLPAGD